MDPRLAQYMDHNDFWTKTEHPYYTWISRVICYWELLLTFFVLCTSNIYCRPVHPRKKDPSSVVLPEVSYFPCLGFFKFFPKRFKGLRAEMSQLYSLSKPSEMFVNFDFRLCK